jgi:C-terminal processing protease CtpA/Prc
VADVAGIVPGDLIVNINGIHTSGLDLNAINGFFNYKPGKKIHLLIDRKGELLRLDFALEDQI